MNKITLRVLAAVSVVLWVGALFLPAFRIGDEPGGYQGWMVAFWGPLSWMTGCFSWFANLYWVYGNIRMMMGRAPNLYLVIGNSLLAASFTTGFNAPGASEGSTSEALPQIGAWIWLLSFAPGLIAGVDAAIRRTRQAVPA